MSDLSTAPMAPLDKIEWRVDSEPYERNGQFTCRYVPYVDAALVASLLDGWVGPGRWQDTYEPCAVAGKEAMWCRLSILDGEWVTKTDIGVPSNMEAQKGAVSDAFKRAACLKWGVARNVYEMPTVFAHCRTYLERFKKACATESVDPADVVAHAALDKSLDELTNDDRPLLLASLKELAAKSDDPGSDGAASQPASSVRTSGPGSSEQEAMV